MCVCTWQCILCFSFDWLFDSIVFQSCQSWTVQAQVRLFDLHCDGLWLAVYQRLCWRSCHSTQRLLLAGETQRLGCRKECPARHSALVPQQTQWYKYCSWGCFSLFAFWGNSKNIRGMFALSPSEKPIMRMLDARTGDREAQEFVRRLKEIEKSMEEDWELLVLVVFMFSDHILRHVLLYL